MSFEERKLFLHFDINKTVIAMDPAAGLVNFIYPVSHTKKLICVQELPHTLNSAISETAWGIVQENEWVLTIDSLSIDKPKDGIYFKTF